MKIELEGRVTTIDSLLRLSADYTPGQYTRLALLRDAKQQVQITLEWDSLPGPCLLCGGKVKAPIDDGPALTEEIRQFHFNCTECSTIVYIRAISEEEATQYFN